jgi:flagellar assembly factor FliW
MRSDNTAPTAADGEHIISMPDGLPGFPDSHSFVLENIDGVGGLGALRSIDKGPALMVVQSGAWFPDYQPEIDDATLKTLEIRKAEDALLLLVVTSADRPQDATANMMAPVVVNTHTRRGAQVVLSGSMYPIHKTLASA